MRETARRLEPDVARLAEGGVRRGTRMRRMERTAQVIGSAAAVAVVFAGVVLIGSHRGVGTGTQPAVIGPEGLPSTPAPTDTAPSDIAPTSPGSTDTSVPQIASSDLIAALKAGLSGTDVTGLQFAGYGSARVPNTDLETNPETNPETSPEVNTVNGLLSVTAQLSIPQGIGSIAVDIFGVHDFKTPVGAPHQLADNTVVYLQSQHQADASDPGKRTLSVTLVRPDGSSLWAFETNSRSEKDPAKPGTPLPLTDTQVITLLDSPTWDDAVVAANAAETADTAPMRMSEDPTVPPASPAVTGDAGGASPGSYLGDSPRHPTVPGGIADSSSTS
jgi:hypothetical protein